MIKGRDSREEEQKREREEKGYRIARVEVTRRKTLRAHFSMPRGSHA